ncbi:S1 family peptidase [Streptomyces sp. NPDC002306]
MTGNILPSTVKALALTSLVAGLMTITPNVSARTQADQPSHDVRVTAGPSGDASQRIADRLGDSHTAGVYLDRGTQRFVVNVTDSEAAAAVEKAGAIPRRVVYDTARLESIKKRLDDGFRTPGTMWGVDVPANQVVVSADGTVGERDLAALKKFVAPYGKAVRVIRTSGETRRTAGGINGGDYIQNGVVSCSYGFTVRKKSDPNYKAILTAGHCTDTSGTDWSKSDGSYIGYTTGHNLADGNDFGLIRAYSADVTYYGNVEAANGDAQDITYSRDSRVHETACASGYKSKYACGTVIFRNQTINWSDGSPTSTGMDVAQICRDHGDSGGPLFAGDAALGLLVGSDSDACQSFYQPVNEALSWYGMEVF